MIKRIFAFLLAIGMVLPLVACKTYDQASDGETNLQITDAPSDTQEDEGVLRLRYDDRYEFETDIEKIENIGVTSSAVGGGRDEAVLRLADQESKRRVIACGTGTATVTLCDGTQKSVEVSPAPISVLLVLGQSNAEGVTLSDADVSKQAREASVVCEEGQVYSTYAPRDSQSGRYIGGIAYLKILDKDNGEHFVASSLTSNKNLAGGDLRYYLNSLSAQGQGKTGIDSALAYEWNRQTGNKVWVINVALGGSGITSWQKGEKIYDGAVSVASAALGVVREEIAAGHYTFADMGYFWVQGCHEKASNSSEAYTEQFLAMHEALKNDLATDVDGDSKTETLSFAGIVLVRKPADHVSSRDLALNGPRTSQMYMGASLSDDFKDVYLATYAGDLWTSDGNVSKYFNEKYADGRLTYPVRTQYAIPKTVKEVHPDIHYRQPGYNELGADAASNMIAMLNKKEGSEAVKVLKTNGYDTYKENDTISIRAGGSVLIGVRAEETYMGAKGIRLVVECNGVTNKCNQLIADSTAKGSKGMLKIYLGEKLVMTLKVAVGGSV